MRLFSICAYVAAITLFGGCTDVDNGSVSNVTDISSIVATPGQKLENAKSLYLEVIRDGNLDAAYKYAGDRYTQHNAEVADGVEGFVAFFEGYLQRTSDRDIRIVRALEDDSFVFLHVYQDIDNGSAKYVTVDLFDTDENDKLIEHWDVVAAYTEQAETLSGNDVVLGDFEITDLDKTEANKALVRCFLVDVFQNANHSAVDKYVSAERFVQHSPDLSDGIEGIKRFLDSEAFNYDFVFKVIGQGNHVVSYSKATWDGQQYAIFDIFRLEDGKIVEHWDAKEAIRPRNEWVNTGKF